MIHAVRHIQQKFLRCAPSLSLGRRTERLIDIDEKLSVQTWLFGRYGIIGLRDNVGRTLYAHYRTVCLVRTCVIDKMYHDFMPCRIAYPIPGAGGEKLRRRLQFPLTKAESGWNASVYDDLRRHNESRCSRTLFETSAKSLGSIEYEARPFVRERMAVA